MKGNYFRLHKQRYYATKSLTDSCNILMHCRQLARDFVANGKLHRAQDYLIERYVYEIGKKKWNKNLSSKQKV